MPSCWVGSSNVSPVWSRGRASRYWSDFALRARSVEPLSICSAAMTKYGQRMPCCGNSSSLQLGRSRPKLTTLDRVTLLFAAAKTPAWRESLMLIKPETLLRWHRQGFRQFSSMKSRRGQRRPRIPAETIALIKQMARENQLWGAERIRGELLKLRIAVSKRTVQKHTRVARPATPGGQSWETFIANHAERVWSCDFVQTYDR